MFQNVTFFVTCVLCCREAKVRLLGRKSDVYYIKRLKTDAVQHESKISQKIIFAVRNCLIDSGIMLCFGMISTNIRGVKIILT